MKYANLPLLQVCLTLFLGIWIGFSDFGLELKTYILSSSLFFGILIILLFTSKPNSFQSWAYTTLSLLFVFSLGVLHTKMHLPKHQSNHYSNYLDKEDLIAFEGEILKPLKPNAYKDKFEVELLSIKGQAVQGKVLLQIPVEHGLEVTSTHKISGIGQISAFKNPANPQQFNHKDYMFYQQMSHVINAEIHHIKTEPTYKFSFINLGGKAREHIKNSLSRYDFTSQQMGLIQALLLGQKQDIDPETYNQFSRAGAVHILAVSGLHVGIILLILQFITKGLLWVKNGRIWRSILVILGIWGFAMLAGFSPSVLRAAVMFSFLSIALNSRRKTSAINTLALSAVVLLIVNPYFIFQVGFQLSYMAVISIVTLQPRLSRLYQPKYYLSQKAWDIITVSLCAQLGVLPLSLYYFHQFPGLFLLSNLVILPGLGILLGGGILIIVLSLLSILPESLAYIYGLILDALLYFIKAVASKEELIFSDIYFTKLMLISSMALVLSILFWNARYKIYSYSIVNLSLLAFMICLCAEKREQLHQEKVIIFQSYSNSHLGIVKGVSFELHTDENLTKEDVENTYHLKNYKVFKGITSTKVDNFKSVYRINNNETLLVIDSLAVYPKENFHPDYLLLKNSPDINLDRVISLLKPKQIIADGSNYKTDVELWKATSNRMNVKFYSTWDEGAFNFPLR